MLRHFIMTLVRPPRMNFDMGGGGSSTVTQTQEFKPPEYTQDGWKALLNAGADMSQQPYQQYQGMKTAPMNDYSMSGLEFMMDRAANGAGDLNAARGQVMDTANGAYLGQGPTANVRPGTNAYAGSNPYLESMIGNTANDMARAHAIGTAAQTDSIMNRSGGYGGSGWMQRQMLDASGLDKNIANMENQYRMGDYTTQQGLAESALGRDLNAQQFNTSANMGSWDAERNRMQSASGQAGTLAQDDWTAGKNMISAGDALRSYQQGLLDESSTAYQDQQNYPWQQLDRYMNVLKATSGSGGSNTASSTQPASSLLANATGLLGTGWAASKFFA